ncbi:hypothetical protein MGU_09246 [Metarhizium guizhouense ARSEF 977]|uniref:Uncharacterized protein n=1 Tax=Metarhizium guizhouense (strain ARSEF 977) TaxID=1276136 RepID=A0A0B4G9N0_METGA|nr:hypothetical protein MGU_09246 [Metarhizium guizhouense ARSEF 977]
MQGKLVVLGLVVYCLQALGAPSPEGNGLKDRSSIPPGAKSQPAIHVGKNSALAASKCELYNSAFDGVCRLMIRHVQIAITVPAMSAAWNIPAAILTQFAGTLLSAAASLGRALM